jgi:phospholipase C
MIKGDNWIGQIVAAIENGPQWNSTAIFITYDDCGCFYDHVPPPAGLGIRLPMVIVSPYAKPGFTDHGVASTASMLAFAEHVLGLTALNARDAGAYDYMGSFDIPPPATPAVQMTQTPVPPDSQQYMDTHASTDMDDDT